MASSNQVRTSFEYDEDAVNALISAATGVARILQIMSYNAETEDYAQASAYGTLGDTLWKAVAEVTRENPMYVGTKYAE